MMPEDCPSIHDRGEHRHRGGRPGWPGLPRDCSPCRDRRPRVGPSTVRATSHRHRIGKRMPCGTVRAMQPDSTRAGDTDRRPPSGESHVAGCPPRLCPEDAPRAARPAAHAVTWPGLDRGRWEDAERKKRRLPSPGSPPAPDCPSTFLLPFSNQIKPLLRGKEGKPREGDLAGLG